MTSPKLPPLIGFTGRAGSGKTTAATWVLRNHNMVVPVPFAAPIKAMATAMLKTSLRKDEASQAASYTSDPVMKETPIPSLGNLTARRIMQTLGTEWGRNTLHPDLWIWIAAGKIERLLGSTFKNTDKVPIKVVIDDLRFANEAEMVRAYGGVVVEIVRPDSEKPAEIAAHESEALDFEPDLRIFNTGSVDDLWAKVESHFPVPPKPAK